MIAILKKTTIYHFLEKNLALIFSLSSFFVITKSLSITDLAIYAYVISIFTIAGTISNFGTSGLLLKILSESTCKKSPIFETLKLRIFISILLILPILLYFYDTEEFYYVLIGTLILPARSLEVIDQKYIYERKFEYVTKYTFLFGLLFLIKRIICLYFDASVEYYLILFSLQIFLNKIFLYNDIKFESFLINKEFSYGLIKRSYMIFIGSVAGVLFLKLPILFLYNTDNDQLTADLFIILQIIMYTSMFAASISAHYYKEILIKKSDTLIKKYKNLMMLGGAISSLFFLVFHKVPLLIFEMENLNAKFMIMALTPMIFFLFLREYYSKMIIINEKQILSVESNFLKLITFVILMNAIYLDVSYVLVIAILMSQLLELLYLRWKLKI